MNYFCSARYLPYIVASALLGFACAPANEDELTSSSEDGIIGGTLATAYPEAATLDIDFSPTGGVICSASLIAPRVVLTAGHCVDGHSSWTVHVGNETRLTREGVTYDWNENGATTVNPLHHDIGLVFLDTPIVIATYPTLATKAVADGSRVTNVGRMRDGVATDELYAADSTVKSGAAIGYRYSYSSSHVIQPGDSGGPDFAVGTHTIVAVNSGAGSNVEVLARVDLLFDWIQGQIRAHRGSSSGGTGPADAGTPRGDSGVKNDSGTSDSGASNDSGAGTKDSSPGDTRDPSEPRCPSDNEPNNLLSKASPLSKGLFCGSLSVSDEDWYTIDAAPGTFTVSLTRYGDALLSIGQLGSDGSCPLVITDVRSFSTTVSTARRFCLRIASPTQALQSYSILRE